MNSWLKYGALIVASYLWGSLCWGIILSYSLKHEDIRLKDNPGLSGSIRQYGWSYGLAVGVLDLLKGYAVSVVLHLAAVPSWVWIASFIAVIVGHNWPIFFQFRGGGGIATTIGILIDNYPLAVLWALPFAAAAAIAWILVPSLKKKLHISPFMTAVGAVPAVLWIVLHKPWYPDYIIVATLAASILLKGNQFHLRAERVRRTAHGTANQEADKGTDGTI